MMADKNNKKSGSSATFFGTSATNWSEFLFGTSKSRAQLGKDLLSYGGMRGAASPLSGGRNVIDTARAVRAMRTGSAGVAAVRANKASGIPARVTLKQMAGVTAKNYGIGRSSAGAMKGLQKSPSKGVASVGGLSTKRKIAGAAVATGAAAYGLSRIPTSSAAAPRQKYSGMKAGAEKVRTGPGGAYVGSGMGAKARPKTGGGAYVGSTVGGNTGSRKTPAAPSGPSGGGGGGRPRQAGASKKQVQARRAAITDLLSKAETAAAAGNIQAAANFSAAALNRQRAGKGSAASMKRVTKVAQAYSTAAGRKKIENQEAGRTRLGKPPVKGKKG